MMPVFRSWWHQIIFLHNLMARTEQCKLQTAAISNQICKTTSHGGVWCWWSFPGLIDGQPVYRDYTWSVNQRHKVKGTCHFWEFLSELDQISWTPYLERALQDKSFWAILFISWKETYKLSWVVLFLGCLWSEGCYLEGIGWSALSHHPELGHWNL